MGANRRCHALAKEGTVLAAELSKDDWFDVGRPWDLLDANNWALKRMDHKVLGTVEQGAHLIGPVTVAESARIRSGAYIEGPAFIDEECDVGPNCFIRSGTSLGRKVRVGNACEIKNSIIMDGTHVGHSILRRRQHPWRTLQLGRRHHNG